MCELREEAALEFTTSEICSLLQRTNALLQLRARLDARAKQKASFTLVYLYLHDHTVAYVFTRSLTFAGSTVGGTRSGVA